MIRLEDLKNKQTVKRNVFKGKGKQILAKRIKQDTSSESENESVSLAGSCDSVGPMSDEEIDMNFHDINIGDYVLINEGKTKGHNIMSIGKILSKFDSEINVQYVKRLYPAFKFIDTNEEYSFDMTKVIAKLPAPKPSGGTNRRSEMLVFPVDLHIYYNELK